MKSLLRWFRNRRAVKLKTLRKCTTEKLIYSIQFVMDCGELVDGDAIRELQRRSVIIKGVEKMEVR